MGRDSCEAPFISPATLRWLFLAVIVVVWELVPRLGLVPSVMLAPASEAMIAGFQDFGTFARALGITFGQLASALIFAYGIGALAGLLLGSVYFLRETLLPIVSSIYAVPLVIVYPLLTAWVGIGPESKVIFGALYGFFPMALSVAAGVQTVDRQYILAARSMGARTSQILFQIMLPASVPSILSGLRIGGAMTAIGVVVAEMMAATGGIGFLITQNRTMFNTAEVYFGIFLVLILTGLLDMFIRLMERCFTNWYPKET
ncbi:ABC transporter permease [Fodinicurvata fenggangensis]|uniref:ABC transporter permease n=1 Tax=Fodinicurvata fenggangensis TaxID=1121830 RepID=UPI0012DEEA06|nr:ABC transporter permease [Fodinicurvata fenggangensis]